MTCIEIDPNGDLVLEVVQYDETISYQAGDTKVPKATCRFKVRREVLVKHSTTWENMLSGPWKESQGDVYKTEDRPKRMETLLRVLHKSSPALAVNIKNLWWLAESLDFYNLDIKLFESFFEQSYDKLPNQLASAKELLYPTWRFNYAKAFAKLTAYLVYTSTGHIQEKHPVGIYHLHLPPRIIQQINSAKGRRRVMLNNGLFSVSEMLLEVNCPCRKETLYDYEQYLFGLDVWPVEKMAATNSMKDMLENLSNFDYHAKASTCSICSQDFKRDIDALIRKISTYFDGLCLDCLDRSKPKFRNSDDDYWNHSSMYAGDWDRGCRIKHGEPTWYFSFMGRKEDMDQFLKAKRQT